MNTFPQSTFATSKALVFDGEDSHGQAYRRKLASKITASLKSPVDYSGQLKDVLSALLKTIAPPDLL